MQALRVDKLKQHFQEFRSTILNRPSSEQKVLMKREESRVSKFLTPPPFLPARDQPSSTWVFPLITKKTCEQQLQAAGFSRFTFHWSTSPFHASSWNRSIALIVADTFYSWVKTVPQLHCGSTGDIVPMVARWVSGQGKMLMKEAKHAASPLKNKSQTAKNAQKARMKRQIAAQRLKCARAQFPNSIDFIALFTSTDSVSDFEDDESTNKPIGIIPEWRSTALNECIRGLDRVTTLTCSTKMQLATHHRLVDRVNTRVADCSTLLRIPKHLPEDAYSAVYLTKCSDVERVALKMTPAIGLDKFQAQLDQRTKRHI